MKSVTSFTIAAALTSVLAAKPVLAQSSEDNSSAAINERVLVTVVLKHDQSMSITEILEKAKVNGFYESFPPVGAKVKGWTIAMGLGQVVTLELPPGAIRDLNRAIEFGAWGSFSTDVYIGYDFSEIAQRLHAPAFASQVGQ